MVLSNWATAAELAVEKLQAREYGARMKEIDSIAAASGLKSQTLRRAVAAWRFLSKIRERRPELARQLETMPVAAVEHIARWHRRDDTGALKAAEALVSGNYTVRSLAQAELLGRNEVATSERLEASDLRGRGREYAFKDRLLNGMRTGLGSPDRVAERARTERFPLPVDMIIDDFLAVMIVGPYKTPELYPARVMDWCLRAYGMIQLAYPACLLVVPGSRGTQQAFEQCLFQLHIRPDSILAAACDPDGTPSMLWDQVATTVHEFPLRSSVHYPFVRS